MKQKISVMLSYVMITEMIMEIANTIFSGQTFFKARNQCKILPHEVLEQTKFKKQRAVRFEIKHFQHKTISFIDR